MTGISWVGRFRSTGFVLLVAIFVCVLIPQAFAASKSGSQVMLTTTVGSIRDLFSDYSDDLSRLTAAYDLIGAADEAKLVDLFEQATERRYAKEDRAWKSELISLVSTQLASINLEKTVSLYDAQPIEEAKYMIYGIMHAWASKDFDGAVEFARKQDASIRPIALRGIVDVSLSLPEATLKDLGSLLGDLTYVERAIRAHKLSVDLADPDEAWTNLINDPTSYLDENFFRVKYVANALIDQYGVAEAENLLSAINSPALSFKLKKSILSKVAQTEPETALDLALATPNDVFGSMLTPVVMTWASIDPESALTRVSLLEPPSVRDRLQEIVVSSWVQLDPTAFLNSVDKVPPELRDTARMTLIGYLSQDSIEDALTVLADMSEATKQEQAALIIVHSWLDSNPDAAFHWIVSSSEIEGFRNRVLQSFLVNLTRQDADKALDLALSRPISGEEEIGLEAFVIDELKFSDTELAMRLLSKARPGATRVAAYESVSAALIYDQTEQRIDEAIELGKNLPEDEQVGYYNSISFAISTQAPPKKILEILPNIPVAESQSKIAERVLMFSAFQKDEEPLSSEDRDTLLEYVAPSDLRRIQMLLNR